MRLQEGAHINKSLLVLSTVIQKLSESYNRGGGAQGHIPYRSSKITRILQNSLGGNALSTIVCNVTPAALHSDETHNTLRFASRAKSVSLGKAKKNRGNEGKPAASSKAATTMAAVAASSRKP